MNAKNIFDRRVLLPISIFLTMLWLPLTTYAQVFEDSARLQNLQDCEKSAEALPASTSLSSRAFYDGPGFGEIDPVDQPSQSTTVASRSVLSSQRQTTIGFSETDPANEPFESNEDFTRSLTNPVFVIVGFSETDPANSVYKAAGDLGQLSLTDCPEENAKNMALQIPEFSSLSVKDSHHDFG